MLSEQVHVEWSVHYPYDVKAQHQWLKNLIGSTHGTYEIAEGFQKEKHYIQNMNIFSKDSFAQKEKNAAIHHNV